MQSLEERVAYLEGRMEDHSAAATDLRGNLLEFRGDVARQFGEIRTDMAALRNEMVRRFEATDDKIDGHFMWILGAQLTVLLAVIGALLVPYFRSG